MKTGSLKDFRAPCRRQVLAGIMLCILLLFTSSFSRGQDFAPARVDDMIFVARPTQTSDPRNFRSGLLQGDGTLLVLNISGLTTTPKNGTFLWEKRSSTLGWLTTSAGGVSLRYEVTFTSSLKGNYLEFDALNGVVRSGAMEFSAVPSDSTPPIVNVSSRLVLAAGQPAFAGFVIEGSKARQVLVRAIGPSLAQFGVTNVAPTPVVTVFKGAVQVGINSGWSSTPTLTIAFAAVGAFALPVDSRDSALLLTLEPGDYTAQARDSVGGEALLEIYLVR